jgi:hypothetical protein
MIKNCMKFLFNLFGRHLKVFGRSTLKVGQSHPKKCKSFADTLNDIKVYYRYLICNTIEM